MSYSVRNKPWGRLHTARADDTRKAEVDAARQIIEQFPELTWGQAMTEATRLVAADGARR